MTGEREPAGRQPGRAHGTSEQRDSQANRFWGDGRHYKQKQGAVTVRHIDTDTDYRHRYIIIDANTNTLIQAYTQKQTGRQRVQQSGVKKQKVIHTERHGTWIKNRST